MKALLPLKLSLANNIQESLVVLSSAVTPEFLILHDSSHLKGGEWKAEGDVE